MASAITAKDKPRSEGHTRPSALKAGRPDQFFVHPDAAWFFAKDTRFGASGRRQASGHTVS